VPALLPEIETDRLRLCLLEPERAAEMARFYVENDAHFAPWDPPRPPGFFSAAYWEARLARAQCELDEDKALRFVLLDKVRDEVVGTANFTAFIRGPFQACLLGYGLDHRRQGEGLMTEGLGAAIDYVFGPLRMHRIMANYVPTNERSAGVLRRLGFVHEGYARDYLFIAGQWRDHILTALVNPRFEGF
jgi:ribosomal-protein-alanine N-acetyltransferase